MNTDRVVRDGALHAESKNVHRLQEGDYSEYRAVAIDDDARIQEFLASHPALTPMTPFQSQVWLQASYEMLAPAHNAGARLVVVSDRKSGKIATVLPLVVTKERVLRIARFADFGVADYGAPLIGPQWCGDRRSATDLWQAILSALPDVDFISLTSMPVMSCAGANPLNGLAGATTSQHARYAVRLDGSVEDYLRQRGKKYRKEVERCYRLLAKEGDWRFRRASTPAEIETAFGELERLQHARWTTEDNSYQLDRDDFSAFYRQALLRQGGDGQSQIFTLEVAGRIIAVLYGIAWHKTFTLLRIAIDPDKCRQASPGRLIVVETMRYARARQISTFDLGIGDYAFKRGFGVQAEPLFDLERAIHWRAVPYAVLMQAKGWLRRQPKLLRAIRAAKQKALAVVSGRTKSPAFPSAPDPL